jgi:hypothetical protein
MEKELKKIGKVWNTTDLRIPFRTGDRIKEIIKRLGINLLIQVDSPGWVHIPRNLDIPTVAYSIDTFINTEYQYKKLERYKYRFYAQKYFARKGEYHLPLGYDPDIYQPKKVWDKGKFDVAFCGTVLIGKMHEARNQHLKALVENVNVYIGRDYDYGANKRYNEAYMVFNFGIENIEGKGGVNMRVFEAMATGTPMLYNKSDGMDELGFKAGEHYIEYANPDDLIKKIRENKSIERISEISKNALQVISNHTYGHRVRKMLEVIING